MKAIFKKTTQTSIRYNRNTSGYEFIDTVDTHEEFMQIVQELEDKDLFPHEDFDQNEILLTASGNEAYDPKYPNTFVFGDYEYSLEDVQNIDPFYESGKISAIKEAKPWNVEELLELIEQE